MNERITTLLQRAVVGSITLHVFAPMQLLRGFRRTHRRRAV